MMIAGGSAHGHHAVSATPNEKLQK